MMMTTTTTTTTIMKVKMMMMLMVMLVNVIISTKLIHAFHIYQQHLPMIHNMIHLNHVSTKQIKTSVTTKTRRTEISMKLYDSNNKNVWSRPELFGTSLIEQTLEEMKASNNNNDSTIQLQEGNDKGSTVNSNSKEERKRQRRSLQQANVPNFEQYVQLKAVESSVSSVSETSKSVSSLFHRKELPSILQLNIGLYCNQACQHCHVESSPLRTEKMNMDVIIQCLTILQNTPSIKTLDITGGAPELHEYFRTLISMARTIRPNPNDLDIIDRCNLTVLQEPNQGNDLIQFCKDHHVHIIASLPCYTEQNVNEQRGNHVFERSIAALLALNDAGYGIDQNSNNNDDVKYKLDLVYNPNGAFLPGPQDALEVAYKEQLYTNFGIQFNNLYTITNMPIQRYADYLYRTNQLIDYMNLLVQNYNPATIDNVMCQNTVSIRYDGVIYDCDFNQQLDIPILASSSLSKALSSTNDSNDNDSATTTTTTTTTTTNNNINSSNRQHPLTVFDITSFNDLYNHKIRTDVHCFGCTAGMGSSCQGSTVV